MKKNKKTKNELSIGYAMLSGERNVSLVRNVKYNQPSSA